MPYSLKFTIDSEDKKTHARAGTITTSRGDISTPAFMPVGTKAAVKGLIPEMLDSAGADIILSNTYHLYLRPGEDVVEEAGGLHSFMHWNKPILTDSGGFQVFSLAKTNAITDEGVSFQSHIDGSPHFIDAEKSMQIQKSLGADIVMAFDECVEAGASREYTEASLRRTQEWLKRCASFPIGERQSLFGIVQGGMFEDLRKNAVEDACSHDLPGYSIGGLSVGESKEKMFSLLDYTVPLLPNGKPRYLMGVGSFDALLAGVKSGIDMFDCVMQTRMGRTGSALVRHGRINLRNAVYKRDFSPLAEDCGCYVCSNYSKAYLRHLVISQEINAAILISYHNVAYTIAFMRQMREAIASGSFSEFESSFKSQWQPAKDMTDV